MHAMQNSVTKLNILELGFSKSVDFSDFHFICLLKHGVFDMPGTHLSIQERFFHSRGLWTATKHTRCFSRFIIHPVKIALSLRGTL